MVSISNNHQFYSYQFLHDCLENEVYIYAREEENLLKRMVMRMMLRFIRPNTRIVYLMRKMQYNYHSNNLIRRLYAIYLHHKIWKECSCYISPQAIIGKGIKIPHPVGIVIGGASKIGANVSIYQNVTIGSRRKGDFEKGVQPQIEEGVTCFSGCQIIGDVIIGKNSVIGAGSVVISSVPPNTVSAGVPSKILHPIKN